MRTGWQVSKLGLRKGMQNSPHQDRYHWTDSEGMCPWPAGGRKTSGQPQARSAIGDARSRGEGGCEARSQVRDANPPGALPGQPEGFEP